MVEKVLGNEFRAALAEFLKLHEKSISFEASDCHVFAHNIGRAAFHANNKAHNFSLYIQEELPMNAALCAIKTYHGFFYEQFKEGGFVEAGELKKVCDEAYEKVASNISFAAATKEHCRIGVGYGVTAYYAKSYSKTQDIIDEALKYCDEAGLGRSCYVGVYESLTFAYVKRLNDFSPILNAEDPFKICRLVEGNNKKYIACLTVIRPAVMELLTEYEDYKGIKKAADFLKGLEGEPSGQGTMWELGVGLNTFYVMRNRLNLESIILECKEIHPDLIHSCIGGMVWTLARLVDTRDSAIKFCSSDLLNSGEQKICFNSIFDSWLKNYTSEEYENMCGQLVQEHASACLRTFNLPN